MSAPLTITIPGTPPSALSQNASRAAHWGPRNRIRDQWKHAAGYATKEATLNRAVDSMNLVFGDDPYRLDITVFWEKGHRIVDDDNLIASFKYARDAIAEAVGVNDKRLKTGAVEQKRDPTGKGYTVVTLTPLMEESS